MTPSEGLDVTLHYFIKDFEGETLFKESETFYIDEEKTLIKEFPTLELTTGKYVVAIEATYPNGVASASSLFEVVEEEVPEKASNLVYVLGSLLILVLSIAVYEIILMKRVKFKKIKLKNK